METTRKVPVKVLSLFLSVLMAFSVFSIALPGLAPKASAAGEYEMLADAFDAALGAGILSTSDWGGVYPDDETPGRIVVIDGTDNGYLYDIVRALDDVVILEAKKNGDYNHNSTLTAHIIEQLGLNTYQANFVRACLPADTSDPYGQYDGVNDTWNGETADLGNYDKQMILGVGRSKNAAIVSDYTAPGDVPASVEIGIELTITATLKAVPSTNGAETGGVYYNATTSVTKENEALTATEKNQLTALQNYLDCVNGEPFATHYSRWYAEGSKDDNYLFNQLTATELQADYTAYNPVHADVVAADPPQKWIEQFIGQERMNDQYTFAEKCGAFEGAVSNKKYVDWIMPENSVPIDGYNARDNYSRTDRKSLLTALATGVALKALVDAIPDSTQDVMVSQYGFNKTAYADYVDMIQEYIDIYDLQDMKIGSDWLLSHDASETYAVTNEDSEFFDPYYVLTEDEELVEGKTYFVLSEGSYVKVEEPAQSALSTYYERFPAELKGIANNEFLASAYGFYAKTLDTAIDEDKTYYTYDSATGEYTAVETPDVAQIGNYYECTGNECPITQANLADLYHFYAKAVQKLDSINAITASKVLSDEEKQQIRDVFADIEDEYNTHSIATAAYKSNYAWFLNHMGTPVEGMSVAALKTFVSEGATRYNDLNSAYNGFRAADQANGGRYGTQVAACQTYLNSAKVELATRAKTMSDAVTKYGTTINSFQKYFEIKGALVNLDDNALAMDAPDNTSADGETDPQKTVNGHTFDTADGLLAWARANGYNSWVAGNTTLKNIWVAVRNYANTIKNSIRNPETDAYNANYVYGNVSTYTAHSHERVGGQYYDFARRAGYYSYTYTTANGGNMQQTVGKIDTFLANGAFTELLGVDEKGYDNLKEYIKGILVENVFSDSMINTIVGLLFPMLSNKLFDDTIDKLVNGMRPYPLRSDNIDADLYMYANGQNGTSSFVGITQALGLSIYPSTFGPYLRDRVSSSTITNAYAIGNWIAGGGRNWSSLDQDGDQEFTAKDLAKKLKTNGWTWGIDSIKRGSDSIDTFAANRFTKTKAVLGAIFGSCDAILKALFTTGNLEKTLSGSGNENLIYIYADPLSIDYTISTTISGNVTDVKALLRVNGLDLYHKLWVPLVEALGINGDLTGTDVMFNLTADNYSGANLCSALLNPIYGLINAVAAKPLESVLKLLPNLCFHLMNRTVYELIRQTITLHLEIKDLRIPDASGLASILEWNWLKNLVVGAFQDKLKFDFDIKLQDVLDLDDLLPFDISDINGLLRGIVNMITKDDEGNPKTFLHLPAINMWKLINACSSKSNDYGTNGGNRNGRSRIYLSAASSYQHVLYLLLDWVFRAAQTPGFIGDVMAFIEGLSGSGIELPKVVFDILNNITSTDDCIAALVELFNPTNDYQMFNMDWYNKGSAAGQNDLHLTYTEFVYLNYGNKWTQEKAEYLYDNLDSIVNDVINMIAPNLLAKYGGDANVWLDSFINSMFNNQGIWNVVDLLVKLGFTLANNPNIAKLIKQQLKGENDVSYNTDLLTWFNTFGYLYADEEDNAELLTLDTTVKEGYFTGEFLKKVDDQYYVYIREKVKDTDLSTDENTVYLTYNASDPTTFVEAKQRAYPNSLINEVSYVGPTNPSIAESVDDQDNYRLGGEDCSVKNMLMFAYRDEDNNLVVDDNGKQVYHWKITLTAQTAEFVEGKNAGDLVTFVDGEKNARAIFTALFCELIGPLAPVFALILSGDDIKLFGDALTLNGYPSYNGAIVPVLEALGVTGLPTQAEYNAIAHGTNGTQNAFYKIVNLLFSAMDELLTDGRYDANGNPIPGGKGAFQKIIDVLPHFFYFLQSDGLTLVVKNLLMSVWTLIDTIRPLAAINLDDLVHVLLWRFLGLCYNPDDSAYQVQDIIVDVLDLIGLDAVPYTMSKAKADKKKVDAIKSISLNTFKLSDIFSIVQTITDLDVTPLKYCFEGMCIQRTVNGQTYGVKALTKVSGSSAFTQKFKQSVYTQPRTIPSGEANAYTLDYYGPDVITVTVSVLLDLLRYKDNAAVLDDLIGLAKETLPGGGALLTENAASGLLEALEIIFEDSKHSANIERPNWDYLLEGKLVKNPNNGNYFNWVDISGTNDPTQNEPGDADAVKWQNLILQASNGGAALEVDLSKYHTLYNLAYSTDWTKDVADKVVATLEGILNYVATLMGSDQGFRTWINELLNEKAFNANIIGILVGYLAQVYDIIPEAVRGVIDELLEVDMNGWEEMGIVRKYTAEDIDSNYEMRVPVEWTVYTYTLATTYDEDEFYYTADEVQAGEEQTYTRATVADAEAFAAGTFYTRTVEKHSEPQYKVETNGDYKTVTQYEYSAEEDYHATDNVLTYRVVYQIAKTWTANTTYYEAHEQSNGNFTYTVKTGVTESNFIANKYYTKTNNWVQIDVDDDGAETVASSYTANYDYKWYDPDDPDYVHDRATFLEAIREIVHSADTLFGYIFLEDDYKVLYTAGDDVTHGHIIGENGQPISGTNTTAQDAIAINGVGLYGLLVVPVLEALKVPLTWERYQQLGGGDDGTISAYYSDAFPNAQADYSPSKYLKSDGTYDTAKWVDDMFVIFEDLTDAILENPLSAILDILPGLIYFINAGGFRTAISNTFGVLQDLLVAVNTVLPVGSEIGMVIEGVDLKNTTLSGLLSIVENLVFNKEEEEDGEEEATAKPKFHINDQILDVCRSLYVGDLTKFTSANGYMSFTMDYSEEEDKADMITILVALLVEVLTDKGTFSDPNNNYESTEYDNAAALTAMFAEDYADVVSEVVGALTHPEDFVVDYKDITWNYFDEEMDLTPVNDDAAEINIPFYAFQYLNYTTSWKYEKALTTVDGIDALAVEVLKMVDSDKFGEITSLGDLINVDTIFTADLVQKLLDFFSGFLFGGDSILSEDLLNLIGAVLGADLTDWNYTYQFASEYPEGKAKEGTANGLDYFTAEVRETKYVHPTEAFSEDETYYQLKEVYTREDIEAFADGVTYYTKTGTEAAGDAVYTIVPAGTEFDPETRYFTMTETYIVPDANNKATAENYTDYYIATDGEVTATRRTYIVNDADTFASAIALVLQPAGTLLAWLLFDDPYEFFVGSTASTHYDVLLTIPGADGYRKGLVLLLEALGCKDLGMAQKYTSGAAYGESGLSGYDLFLYDLAHSITNRLLEIAENPVREIIDLIPELIYFINANGLGVVVNNLLAGPLALVGQVPHVVALIDEDADPSQITNVVDDLVAGLLNDALKDTLDLDGNDELDDDEKLTFSMNGVNLKWIFDVVEKITGLKMPALQTSMDKFFIGKLEAYASKSGAPAYRMVFDDRFIIDDEHPASLSGNGDRADFLTILLSFLVDTVIYVDEANGIDNGVALANLINKLSKKAVGDEGYIEPSLIQAIVKLIHDDHTVGTYNDYDWMYFTNGADPDYSLYDYDETTGKLTRRTTTTGEGENQTTIPTTPIWNTDTSIEVGYNAFNYLTYNSDWTEETAQYLVDNRTEILNAVLSMAGVEGTVSDAVKGLFDPEKDLYTAEMLNKILVPLKELVGNIPEVLLKVLGIVLDIDLSMYDDMDEFVTEYTVADIDAFEDGVTYYTKDEVAEGETQTYTAVTGEYNADTTYYVHHDVFFTDGSREDFINCLTEMISPLYMLLDWLLFGQSIEYFDKKTYSGTVEAGAPGDIQVLIKLGGADGYKYGLVPLLDALGVAIPTIPEGGTLNAETVMPTLLNNILARVEAILNNPVDEVLNMIPELLYFINANGLATAVHNLLGGVFNLVEKVAATGILDSLLEGIVEIPEGGELNIADVVSTLLNDMLGVEINIEKLDLLAILELVRDLTAQEIATYSIAAITAFVDGTTYYTVDKYDEVKDDAEFDENAVYFTKTGDDYTVASITEFAEGVTYYTASYKKVGSSDEFKEDETYYTKTVIASHEGIDLVAFCTAKRIEDFYFGKLNYVEGSADPYLFHMNYDAEQDMADLLTIIVNLAIEFLLYEEKDPETNEVIGRPNAEAIDALINGIDETGKPKANTVDAIVKILLGLKEIDKIEPEEIDWDYFLVTGELSNTGITMPESMFVYLDYSNLWTRDLANGLGSELTALVNEILAMVGSEQTLQEMISGLVDLDELLTADILNSILDLVAPLLYGEDSFLNEALLNIIGLVLGADLTQWNNTYRFEKFDSANTYATEPGTNLKYREGTMTWTEDDTEKTFTGMIYAIENATDFANGLTLVLKPAQKLLGWLLLGNDYRFFVSKEDGNVGGGNELLVVPGFDGYDYSLTLLLEALGCTGLKKGSEYEGDEAEMINDVINAVINRINGLLNAENPVNEILDLVAELIYFVNAGGLNAVVVNLVGGLFEVVKYVNESGLLEEPLAINGTELNSSIIDTLVKDVLNNALKDTLDADGNGELSEDEELDFALKNINLDWIIALAEKLTGFEISDPIGSTYALSRVMIGTVERYDSASSAYDVDGVSQTYRVASAADTRGDLITILLSVVLDVLKYKDDANNIDNAATLAGMLEGVMDGKITVTVIDAIIDILDGWAVANPDNPDWFYNVTDPQTYATDLTADDTVTLRQRTIYYLTYGSEWVDAEGVTNLWTRETAEYVVEHIDDIISDVMAIAGQPDSSVAKILQGVFSVESDLYTADNLNKIADAVKGLAENLTGKIKEVIGMVTGINLAAYDEMHFEPEEINSREAFVDGLVEVLNPLYTLLDWLLFGKDLAFLYDNEFYNNGFVKAEGITEFEANRTYYTLSYTEVPADAAFNPNADYYTMDGDDFVAADITAFAEDTTYYVATYTKATAYAAGTTYYTDLGGSLIKLSGGYGYNNSIVPLLEALDIEVVSATKMEDAKLKTVLNNVFARLEEILADPVNKGLGILPNLIYFINANGISVVVGNLLCSLSGLINSAVPLIIELVGESIEVGDVTIRFTDDNHNQLDTDEIINNVINGLLPESINFEINYKEIDLLVAVKLVEALTGLKIVDVVTANKIDKFYIGDIEYRKSANGNASYFMSYSDAEGAHDMLTIVLNLVVEVLLYKVDGQYVNIDALCELVPALAENRTTITAVIDLLTNPREYTYTELDWNYFDRTAVLGDQPIFVPKSQFIYLAYANNWNFNKAATLDATLATMVDEIIGMLDIDGNPASLQDLLAGLVDIDALIAKPEYLNSILDLLKKYLYGEDAVIGQSLLDLVGLLLNAELSEWDDEYAFEAYDEAVHTLTDSATGLKYRVDGGKMYYGIATVDDFINGLCKILEPANAILGFLLMGESYGFFTNNADGTKVLLRVNGAEGYKKGLALILEALGVKGLQSSYESASDMLKAVLTGLVNRVKEILENPIEEVLGLITELIYFINAKGLSVAVNNLAPAVFSIIDAINNAGMEVNLDVDGLINGLLTDTLGVDIGFALDNINIQWIVNVAEVLLEKYVGKIEINAVLADSLRGDTYPLATLAIGQAVKYPTVTDLASAYKMVFAKPDVGDGEYVNNPNGAATRADMITILLSFAIDFFRNEQNRATIEDAAGLQAGIIADILAVLSEYAIEFDPAIANIDWFYFDDDYTYAEGDDLTMFTPTIQYLSYASDWTEELADYLDTNLDTVVAKVLELVGQDSIADIIKGVFDPAEDLYTAENLNKIALAVANLTKSLSDVILQVANLLLDADLAYYKNICTYDAAAEEFTECTYFTAEAIDGNKAAFIAGLKELLAPIYPVLDWLLFGENYAFFNRINSPDNVEDLLVINGYDGYAYGLVPILEALGVVLPSCADHNAPTYNTENMISDVLSATLFRMEQILADPVEEVLALIPNLLYFINANGLAYSVNHLAGAALALVDKVNPILEKLNIEIMGNTQIDVNDLINGLLADNGIEVELDITDLRLIDVVEIVEVLTGLKLTDFVIENGIENFYLGQITYTESSNGEPAFKMVYSEDPAKDRADMITVLFNYLIEAALYKETDADDNVTFSNAAVIDGMIGNGNTVVSIISMLEALSTPAVPGDYHWNYFNEESDDVTPEPSYETITTPVTPFNNHLKYTTDWTQETANTLYDNLDDVITAILTIIAKGDPDKATTVAEILDGSFDLFTADILNKLTDLIKQLYDRFDATLVNLIGTVLGCDLSSWVGLHYGEDEIYDPDTFKAGLYEIVSPLARVLDWLLFGESYGFFVADKESGSDGSPATTLINVGGAEGYIYGLAQILYALGVDLPAYTEDTTCDTPVGDKTFLQAVLDAVVDRVVEILADPVDEALELLPELLYFVNANGVSTAAYNLAGGVLNAINVLFENHIIELKVDEVVYDSIEDYLAASIGVDIRNLDLEGIIGILEDKELTKGIKINDVFKGTYTVNETTGEVIFEYDTEAGNNILEKFYCGTVQTYVYGGFHGWEMVPAANAKGDILTMLLSIVLDVLYYEGNEQAIADLINGLWTDVEFTKDNFVALKALLQEGATFTGNFSPNWAYFFEDAEDYNAMSIDERVTYMLGKLGEGKLPAMKGRTQHYLEYDNNWNEAVVTYLDNNINDIVDLVINMVTKGEYLDLEKLIEGKLNIYSADIVNKIVDRIAGLLSRLDEVLTKELQGKLIATAGSLLGLPADVLDVVTTPATDAEVYDKATFVNALVTRFSGLNRVLDWLLFNKSYTFFTDLDDGADAMIVINGGEGYKYGLAPILAALGVDTNITATSCADGALREVLGKVADRIDELLYGGNGKKTLNEVLALLPELIYFINTGAVSEAIMNLLQPADELLKVVNEELGDGAVLGKDSVADFFSFTFNGTEYRLYDTNPAVKNYNTIDFDFIFDIVKDKIGIDIANSTGTSADGVELGKVGDYIKTFYFGKLESYTSYDEVPGYKMNYSAEDTRMDMLTILVTLVLDVFTSGTNEDAIVELLGGDADAQNMYNVIYSFLTGDLIEVQYQKFDWMFEEYADTGIIVSPMTEDGTIVNQSIYGPLYTRAMGEYMTKYLQLAINTYITLLGVKVNGKAVFTLDDILQELVGSNIYKNEYLQSIYNALLNLLTGLKYDTLGEELYNHIAYILKNATKDPDNDEDIGVDLNYWFNEYTGPDEIEEGNQEQFIAEVCEMLRPAYPVLRWLLTESKIAFFNKAAGADQYETEMIEVDDNDYLVLNGAKGYKYGIIPILEALCNGDTTNIKSYSEYLADVEGDPTGDALLKDILTPILCKVDDILADPINGVLNLLPAVVYFVGSNGLDTCFKNILGSVYTLLFNIDPLIANVEQLHDDNGDVSLYPLIGIDLKAINLETLLRQLLDSLKDSTGFALSDLGIELFNELAMGVIESYESQINEDTFFQDMYTMKYATEGTDVEGNKCDTVDFVTIILRLVLTFISDPDNVKQVEAMLKDKVSGDGYTLLCSLLDNFSQMVRTADGKDKMMYTVYYVFYSALCAGVATNNAFAEFNGNYSFLNSLFNTSDLAFMRAIGSSLTSIFHMTDDNGNEVISPIIDETGVVPQGQIPFWQKIIEFFKQIINFFKNMFK